MNDAFLSSQSMLNLSLAVPALVLAALLPLGTAHASGVVTNCTEADLRIALAGGGLVTLACDGTIVLTNTLIIAATAEIDASGRTVILSGGGTVRPLTVNNGVQLTLKHLTVTDGFATYGGGGILNFGNARLINCTLSNNVAIGTFPSNPAWGGGIFHKLGNLHLSGCTFVGNRTLSVSGGIGRGGGAIASGFMANENMSESGAMFITNCTFAGNSAQFGGGIVFLSGSLVRLTGPSTPVIVNCTFAGNTNGAVSYNLTGLYTSTNKLVLINTVLGNNYGSNCFGVADGGYNISSDNSGGFTHPYSLENTDPRLGSLAANGGPTLTMALLADSPAIDGGSSPGFPFTDQRGISRPSGASSDSGAFEFVGTSTNAGVFQIIAVTNTVGEGGAVALFSVIRAGGTTGDVTIGFATGDDTGSAGLDYTATNGVLSFSAGTRSLTVAVPVLEDVTLEGNEAFHVTLSSPTGGAELGRARADVTIADNDSALQFTSASYAASEGAGNTTITVIRAGSLAGAASVNCVASSGTAVAGVDFVPTNRVLSFAPGQSNATFAVTLLNDLTPEGTETVLLTLSGATGTTTPGDPVSATLQVADDDPIRPGTIHFLHTSHTVSERSGEVMITVGRADGTNGPVSAEFFVSGGTATTADYPATTGTVTLLDAEARKSFAFSLVVDAVSEGPETIQLSLRNPTGGAAISSHTATITILDAQQNLAACDEASLRAAVAGGGHVVLACDGTIFLSSPLTVSNGVSLDATGHSVRLSGSNVTRHFVVHPGVSLDLRQLTLSDGYIVGVNGAAGQPGGEAEGGAIHNLGGVVRAEQCEFVGNRAMGGIGGLTISPGGPARGGAVCNLQGGVVMATNCYFGSNSAFGGGVSAVEPNTAAGGNAAGGAVFNRDGRIELRQCTLSNNRAQSARGSRYGGRDINDAAQGGAVYTLGGSVLLSDVILDGNSSTAVYFSGANGGAISSVASTLEMTDCDLIDNRAEGGFAPVIGNPFGWPGGPAYGGGIYCAASSATIERTCIRGGLAFGGSAGFRAPPGGTAYGGGVYCGQGSTLVFRNCTLVANHALAGQGFNSLSLGAAFCNENSVALLSHLTIAANSASGLVPFGSYVSHGSGIFSSNGITTLRGTILSGNLGASNCFGPIIDGAYNLSSDGTPGFTAASSVNHIDPLLGPLADYGGPAPTMALLAGSLAIDAVSAGPIAPTDQRGRPRPFGAGSDIGAFESSAPYTVVGRVSGFLPASPIIVSSGLSSDVVDPTGAYAVRGFTAGPHLLTPASPECVFVLSNRLVQVGPDVAGVDFHSYRSNALVMERVTGPAARGIFAAEATQTYRVLSSTNLSDWTPWSTNTTETSGLFEFLDTTVPMYPQRFFQVVLP